MSPLVGWPSVLGLSSFAAGLYMYRGDLWAPGTPWRSRMLSLAPVFIAAALATFCRRTVHAGPRLLAAITAVGVLMIALTIGLFVPDLFLELIAPN
jgi:hypothetical protein